MKYSNALVGFLEELQEENLPHTVVTHPGSKMVVVVEDPSKGELRYEFLQEHCKNILSSRDAVERFFEALNFPEEAFVELHELVIDQDVLIKLENTFSTVDEF